MIKSTMRKMKLTEVTLQEYNPNLTWKFRLELSQQKILVISFIGKYRYGSGGNNDTEFMIGIIFAGCRLFRPQKVVYDFSELDYEWGNTIFNIVGIDKRKTIAIIVGSKCEKGLSGILGVDMLENENKNVFRSLEEAITFLNSNDEHFQISQLGLGFF